MSYALPDLPAAPMPPDAAHLLDGLAPAPAVAAAIAAAWAYAPHLRTLMRRRSRTLRQIVELGPDAVLTEVMLAARGEPVAAALRQAKADVALTVALADLARIWPLERVTVALSDFADLALDRAVAAAVAERTPGAMPEGFAVLSLGKHGSRELNYSSDVDLIFLHDRVRLPRRARDEADEAAVRIARRVVELMQARDADGYVFRVDLRLRPSPEATPITLPVGAAESYYQSEALPWERAAFIRARACAGDTALGETFLDAIRPFVWRRSLDYSAIRDIQAISLRIRDHFEEGQAMGPGFDLKRGRGGIREVEFFAQIHQMIFGGRAPALRVPATLDALAALAAAGRIRPEEAVELSEAYRLFREVEHRIQMRDDEQTHRLPAPPKLRADLAAFCGYANWRALEAPLAAAARRVAARYDSLVSQAGGRGLPRDAKALNAQVAAKGFGKPAALVALIETWRTGKYRALRTAEAQAAFETVLPKLLDALAAVAEPDAAAVRLDSFLAQLPSGVQFLELLAANPRLADLLARLLGVTPVLAEALARKPDLFDVMLDPTAFAPFPDAAALTADLRSFVGAVRDAEEVLDRVRRWTAERRFQLGAHLIEGATDPLRAARSYSDLADAALGVLAPRVCDSFAEVHGVVPGGELAVLGLGRYGGRALTVRSDLDLVYVFAGAATAESDGRRPLGATHYYNKLAQRLTAALSVPTAAGALYEIDTRLRPSGTQGLLAVAIDSFARYQREDAWTWEHMALTRARVVHGSDAARATLASIIVEVLAMPRDPVRLRRDVLEMRRDMDVGKPGQGLWDVKLGRGGLVDLEFLVHFRQLRDQQGLTPDLRAACEVLFPELVPTHDLLTRLLVTLRLVGAEAQRRVFDCAPTVGATLARACAMPNLAALEESLRLAKAAVLAAWESVFDEPRRGTDA